jgi:hypothetical protein
MPETAGDVIEDSSFYIEDLRRTAMMAFMTVIWAE